MKSRLLSLALLSLSSCKKDPPEPAFTEQQAARSERVPSVSDAGASALLDAGAGAATGAVGIDASMYTHFSHRDDIPLCVVPDWDSWQKMKFLKDVPKSVALKADASVTFATYAPECASLDCVLEPNIQCWVDVGGNDITVHTRYHGERRGDPTLCQTNCQEVTGSCSTPALAAGKYTVHYGARTWKIKVPSVLRPTCIPLK